jgi:predicted O-methyltransferase YrrM
VETLDPVGGLGALGYPAGPLAGPPETHSEALETFKATSLERELAEREDALAAAWIELEAIRSRRIVRLADRLQGLRRRFGSGSRGSQPSAPSPTAPPPTDPTGAEPATGDDRSLFYWPSLTHFHSPVPDTALLSRPEMQARLWPPTAPEQPGVDWHGDAQLALVAELAAQEAMTFPATSDDPTEFFSSNPAFAPHDAWATQALLRHLRPRRMVELGSGWTSLLAARVNREHLGQTMRLTCVDPYLQEFLRGGVDGIDEVVEKPAEDLPLSFFESLEAGDVLFIDTTHTVKTGSDVVYLFGEVIPRLAPGVVVHVHDIFLPGEYPKQWVLSGWAWNEQYLVQAFLAFNREFEVLLSLGWLANRHPETIERVVPGFESFYPGRGGSLWLRRAGA